jgi:hypothetical protein
MGLLGNDPVMIPTRFNYDVRFGKMNTIQKYAAVFGRNPAIYREPVPEIGVAACMFPALKRSFWKSLSAEAHDSVVHITAGLSAFEMPSPSAEDASRIELFVTSPEPVGGGESVDQEVPGMILQDVAEYIVTRNAFVGLGHTLDFRSEWVENSPMRALLFAMPVGVDVKRICKCSRAQDLLTPVPLTAPELELCRSQGVLALLDRFEAAGVEPVFDAFRKSSV